MYKVLLIICSIFTFSQATAALNIPCSPELKPYIDKIQELPEAREVLDQIWKEGSIKIYNPSNNNIAAQFGACWDMERRIIFVNANRPKGQVFKSILFELQNALVNKKLAYYDQLAQNHQIGREEYIRSIEHLEFINSKNGARIAEAGISKGLFPEECRFHTYKDFEEHYRWQQYGGHSAVIGQNYDFLAG